MLRASSRPLVGCMAACSEADLFRHAAGLHCERLLRAEVTNQEFQKKGSEVHPDWKAGPREGGWMWIQLSCTGPACDAAGGSCTRALQTRMDNAYSIIGPRCAQEMQRLGCLPSGHRSERSPSRLWIVSGKVKAVAWACSRSWAWTSFARPKHAKGLKRAQKRWKDVVPWQADGSLIFLEANRDPSWVIDGGVKQEPGRRLRFVSESEAIIPALVRDLLPGSAWALEAQLRLSIVLRAHGEGSALNPGGRSSLTSVQW